MRARTLRASVILGGLLLVPLVASATPPSPQSTAAKPAVANQPVAKPADLYAALPSTTQAVIAVQDLRAWLAEFNRSQRIWHETAAGKAHQERRGWMPMIEGLVSALGGTGAAPAALVLHMVGGEPTMQLMMRAEPAALPRLSQLGAKLPFSVVVTGPKSLTFSAADVELHGRLGADGWLRIGEQGPALSPPSMSLGALPGRVGKRIQGRAVVAWVDLAGPLGQALQRDADASAREFVGGLRAVGLSADFSEGEWEVDMLADHGGLAMFQSAARRADLKNHFLPLWGSDATTIASLSLPPVLFQQAAAELAQDPDALPGGMSTREFAALLAQLDGRIGYAGFQSPGDWALALRTGSGANTKQLLSTLQGVIEAAADAGEVKTDGLLSFAPGGFHLRPDPALHGLVGFARGADLVFATDTRRTSVLRPKGGKGEKGARGRGSAADHARYWKPRVKALMERPAILLVYMLYPDAHDLFAMMSWAMGAARAAWNSMRPPDAAILDSFVDGLALDYAAAAVQADMLYDFALRLDLEDGLLVFQTAGSEL